MMRIDFERSGHVTENGPLAGWRAGRGFVCSRKDDQPLVSLFIVFWWSQMFIVAVSLVSPV